MMQNALILIGWWMDYQLHRARRGKYLEDWIFAELSLPELPEPPEQARYCKFRAPPELN